VALWLLMGKLSLVWIHWISLMWFIIWGISSKRNASERANCGTLVQLNSFHYVSSFQRELCLKRHFMGASNLVEGPPFWATCRFIHTYAKR
jgi:hypothetical protein